VSVLFAPDSFKGSIGAAAAASALASGWASVRPGDRAILRPIADGGEGTLDAFAAAVPGAERMPVVVTGPDGEPTRASWLLLPATPDAPRGTAVVELASTSGIELLGDRRLPWDAGTTGFGQAIGAALDHGVSRLVLGIGSSASTDGGAGMLTALGARLTDAAARPIAPGARGLQTIVQADLSGLRVLPDGGVLVLSDVTNPLFGPTGAAAVFGPQKGLPPEDVPRVDDGLRQLAGLLATAPGPKTPAIPPPPATPVIPTTPPTPPTPADPATPGAGAAGGTGFALLAWGARLVPGAAEVAALVGLPAAIAEASVVVTGEGSYDGQSAAGKAPAYVAGLAAEAGAVVALAAGRIDPDASTSAFAATVSLTELAGSPAAALAEPARWLHEAGAALARANPSPRP
jgi:glycerate kinase